MIVYVFVIVEKFFVFKEYELMFVEFGVMCVMV